MLSQRELSDQIEIAQLIQRYGAAIDARDYARLDTVFTGDARTHYDLGKLGNRTTWPQMRELFETFNVVFSFTSHLISAPLVELHGDEARAESRLVATHGVERLDGEKLCWTVVGHYRDRLLRTADGWRIHERRFVGLHTSGELPPAHELRRFENPAFREETH